MKNIFKLHSVVLVSFFLIGILLNPLTTYALPAGFEFQTIASGFVLPTTIAFTQDGRIFVAEKGGAVKVIKNGVVLPTPLIQLSDVNSYGDRGLIGMAIDPNFSTNGYLYLAYTYENTPGTSFSGIKTARVVRVTVVGDVANESTKTILVGSVGGSLGTPSCDNFAVTSDCIASDAPSHSIGGLRFGNDGKLYVATGDGAHFDYADNRSLRAQNIDSLAGKILRINTDGTAPADNPFYNGNPNSNRSKVYAYGFRNPFRFNFRPSNNSLYAGDVGWNTWEEVDKIVAGGNYGWPCKEGNGITVGGLGCNAVNPIDPLYTYQHDANGAGSVTSGAFPTGSAYPSQYLNTFFFGDYAQNWIKTMTVSATDTSPVISNFATAVDGTNGPVEFLTGPEGNVYFLAIYTGELIRINHTSGNRQPVVSISATPTSGIAPLSVNFSSVGTNDPDGNPITYLWNFGDNATSTLANPTHIYSSNGVYTASLRVRDDQGGEQTKSVTITVGNQAPTAQINTPSTGSLYTVGQNITLNGAGLDPETGNLPDSALFWRVILHHNTHIHILETHTGNNITIVGPDHGDPAVYTEIELTVTDPAGLTNTKSVNIYLNNSSGNSNLVDNGDLETQDPQQPGYPASWTQDWWGSLTATFTYPATGSQGVNMRGARLQVTNYVSGDAKWVFSPISTQGNTTYTFSDYYTSNVTSTLVAQIGYINGTYSYINLGTVPAATNFTKVTKTFTTPVNARNVTVFHLLESNGILTVDDFVLSLGTSTPPSDTTKPLVSITSPVASSTVSNTVNITASSTDNVAVAGVKFLIDNVQLGIEDTTSPYSVSWNTASSTNGSHSLTAVSRDTSGNIATSTPVLVTVSNSNGTTTGVNLITNGTFEAGTTLPTGWTKGGWGTNTRVLTYPVAGDNSPRAIRTEITAYTSGDAKWVPTKINITPGKQYRYSDRYRSNVISDVIGEYTLSNGTLSYFGAAKDLAPSTNWTTATGTFSPPTNATKVTFYHLISSIGYVEVDNVEVMEIGTSTPGETIPPVVQFLTPANNQIVSGTVNITASSSDNVAVTYIYYALDGLPISPNLTTAPYAFAWNTASTTNGTHILKATTHDPSGNNSTSTVTVIVNNATSTPDTTKPLVSITSPVASSTVSNTVNITASSTDNVAVAGVKFLIDNVQLGIEDTTSPYSVSWNTASSTNGSHSLTAVSRDTSGNIATSTPVLVTVSNSSGTTTPPAGNNLILNPSVETANGAKPLNWNNSKWGTNTVVFNYPTSGQDGAKAVGINVTAYTNGDAKWFFDDVNVTPGQQYVFTEYYKSNVATNITARYRSSTGTYSYAQLSLPPVATNWTQRSVTFTPPAGTVSVTIFHLINRVGTLEVDNYSLSAVLPTDNIPPSITLTSPTASSTLSGQVNLTASSTDNNSVSGVQFYIDGVAYGSEDTTSPYSVSWNTASSTDGIHSIYARSRDNSGNTATTSPISVTVSNIVLDTIAPTISFTQPTDNSNASNTITAIINANDNVQLSNIKMFIDGIIFGTQSSTSPAIYNIDTTTLTNGSHVLLGRAEDSSNNIATTSININVNNIVPDTLPPTVSIAYPTSGSTIGGTLTVNVTATDDTAVSDVHIIIDGENIGVDSTFPYSSTIDTTSLANGQHTASAYAQDLAGNIGNATDVVFTVYNAPITPPTPNLIQNPSLETENPGNPNLPQNWFQGGWGTNTATFTYPIVGINGPRAARIDISSYTNGDAKWYFADVPANLDTTYLFSEQYRSNTPTTLTARFTYPDNSVQYRDIITLPAVSNWSTAQATISIPATAVSMTVFHVLNSAGFLEIDNYYLAPNSSATSTNTFAQGMVSLTFDDGWLSQYDLARPILNNAGIKGGFYIISQESIQAVPDNRILNANFEIVDPNSSTTPQNWNQVTTGVNNTTFTYPISGVTGNAVKVEISNYTSGSAQWMPDPSTAISGQKYKYSGSYKSDVTTKVVMKSVHVDNSSAEVIIATLPPAVNWTNFSFEFTMDANLKNVTLFNSIDSVGYLYLDNVDLNRVQVFVNPTQIMQMYNDGHEIGSHTQTHPDLSTLTTLEATNEIVNSRVDLLGLGLWPVDTFVYPYGGYNAQVEQIVKSNNYIGARSVDRGYNLKDTDRYALKIQQVDQTTTFAQFQTWVDDARNNKTWLILMFHQVDSTSPLGVTPQLLQQMVDFLVQQQVTVVTMQQGLGQMNP